jgi:hypothetical protein
MSVYETKAFLDTGLPPGVKLSGTAGLVHIIITDRYDTRAGKKSAYPGMDCFLRVTGKSRSTIQDAIKELLVAGLIIQKTKGRRGSRAEYVPVYALRLRNSVGISDTNYDSASNKVSRLPVISIASTESQRPVLDEFGSAIPYVLNTLNTLNTSKYNKSNYVINQVRWSEITSSIDEKTMTYINPAPNSEKLLDELEQSGLTRQAIRDHVGRINYTTAGKVGGVFIDALKALAGVKRITKSESVLPWCGKCEFNSRQFDEASEINGRLDYDCSICHPSRKRRAETPFDFNSFNNFGKLPD